ncbi:MAG: EscU/YscU/HrcU family type III secretion system export apparatus switch protein [Oligoflexia bacterium]|nr:EscU/YscU/HrcU family type III secretion system export apparatus switch protein [Oligoflexia bacterium]
MSLERRHPATEQRRKQAYREGRHGNSSFPPQLIAITVSFLMVVVTAQHSLVSFKMLLEYSLSEGLADWSSLWQNFACLTVLTTVLMLAPAGVAALVHEAGRARGRVGFRIRRPLMRGVTTIGEGARASLHSGVRLMVLAGVIGLLARQCIAYPLRVLIGSAAWQDLALNITAVVWLEALVVVLLDQLFKRRAFLNSLRMSDHELKQEQRENEGDPQQRALRRAQHEALLMQDVVSRVKRSKVIIVERINRPQRHKLEAVT